MMFKRLENSGLFGSSLILYGFSFLASGQNKITILAIASAFGLMALFQACSHRLSYQFAGKTADFIAKVPISHVVVFLPIAAFGIILLQNGLVIPGGILLLVAYGRLAWHIGHQLGYVLKHLILKLEHILID